MRVSRKQKLGFVTAVVELITIAGAGHQWPGSPSKLLVQRVLGADLPSTALDATDVS